MLLNSNNKNWVHLKTTTTKKIINNYKNNKYNKTKNKIYNQKK